MANDESILDVADLVFIDPVSTGFTRAIPGKEASSFYHFTRDIEMVGRFIRLYLNRFGRWASPKYLIGESYGTTRSAGLARHLLERYGMYLNGVILISSVLNFQTIAVDKTTKTFSSRQRPSLPPVSPVVRGSGLVSPQTRR